jgi:hypothetical protein
VLLLCSSLKYILGRSPKVKKIHRRLLKVVDMFVRRSRWVTCQSARYDRCIGYVSTTVYVLALSSDSGFPGFGYPGVVVFLIEFPFR